MVVIKKARKAKRKLRVTCNNAFAFSVKCFKLEDMLVTILYFS